MFSSIPRFNLCHVLSSSTNNLAHAQTLYRMSSLCRSYKCMNIARVNIGVLTGWKKIKQRPIAFVLGYLRMTLWKISTAISIKHRILATFNKKKSILTACMPLIIFDKHSGCSLYLFRVIALSCKLKIKEIGKIRPQYLWVVGKNN